MPLGIYEEREPCAGHGMLRSECHGPGGNLALGHVEKSCLNKERETERERVRENEKESHVFGVILECCKLNRELCAW